MAAAPSAGPLTSFSARLWCVDSFGQANHWWPTDVPMSASGPPCLYVLSQRKSVREHTHSGRAARRWQVMVGVRWQRFQSCVAALYFQRVTLPVRFWRAAGCPVQFRPQLPWWHRFVLAWLRLSGWRSR